MQLGLMTGVEAEGALMLKKTTMIYAKIP